mmetsp:Transcript_39058/g.89983  ORF Transcript_39058/g.89983 Transcript_39058/m.89983 type:complete len:534 (-) Transcript_39058:223-1824(-)
MPRLVRSLLTRSSTLRDTMVGIPSKPLATLFLLSRAFGSTAARTAAERLHIGNMNTKVLGASYAVRGPVLDRALELQHELSDNPGSLPFDEIVQCNIGNPQSLGQLPLSFHRQVLSLIMAPELLSDANLPMTSKLFNADTIERAKRYAASVPSMGAYTHSQGIHLVREEIKEFIEARDGVGVVDPEQIFLTNGASEGVRITMQCMMRQGDNDNDGVLVPIPQYPLYSASCALMNGALVPYYLAEESGWGLEIDELKRQLSEAREKGIAVRGLVVINPGNPTGNTLSYENMKDVVEFCVAEKLVLMADEVYQENIWRPDRPFFSFRKVAVELGYEDVQGGDLQLISFHSVSKGFIGECGIRGGYFELFGIDDDVKAQMYKLASISLCSNTPGQVMTGLMVKPPAEGEESFSQYNEERLSTLASLKRRADKVASALDALPGVHCRPSDGALYAFPRVDLPDKFVKEAEANGMPADEVYCLKLLSATGVVVVPGSGFGQVDGTWHFRTTFLPPEEKVDGVMERITAFHNAFMTEYA